MAEFLTTAAIASFLDEMLRTTQHRIVLVSPYLQFSKTLSERLRDCDARGVPITVIYRSADLGAEEDGVLARLKHLDRYRMENLHAKCYCDEDRMVIGSMNLYHYSEKYNREMGVLLTRNDDRKAFDAARMEIESIVNAARREGPRPGLQAGVPSANYKAHCIRCKREVRADSSRPLCLQCFTEWPSGETRPSRKSIVISAENAVKSVWNALFAANAFSRVSGARVMRAALL